MPRTTRIAKLTRNQTVVKGLEKYFPGRTLMIEGKRVTTDAFIADVRRHDAAMEQVAQAKAALRVLVAEERALEARVHTLVMGLKGFARAVIGQDVVVLAALGLALPKKTGPKTVAAKAAGAAKGLKTRAERGTMGKRQRAKRDRER